MRNLVGRTSHTLFDESIAGRRTWLRLHNPKRSSMTPRCQAFFTPRANTKQLSKQNGWGSELMGKLNAEPGGAVLPRYLRRINRRATHLAQAPQPQV